MTRAKVQGTELPETYTSSIAQELPEVVSIPVTELQFGNSFRGVLIPPDVDGLYVPDLKVDDILPSIVQNGVLEPIVVWEDPSLAGTAQPYRIIQGHRRVTAVRRAISEESMSQDTEIPAIVRSYESSLDATDDGLRMSAASKSTSPYEEGAWYYRCAQPVEEGGRGWTQNKIANHFCVSPSAVSRRVVFFRRAHKLVKLALSREDITLTQAMSIIRLAPDMQEGPLRALIAANFSENPTLASDILDKLDKEVGKVKPPTLNFYRKKLKAVRASITQWEGDPTMATALETARRSERFLTACITGWPENDSELLYGFKG